MMPTINELVRTYWPLLAFALLAWSASMGMLWRVSRGVARVEFMQETHHELLEAHGDRLAKVEATVAGDKGHGERLAGLEARIAGAAGAQRMAR
jgi:hypothetical protein